MHVLWKISRGITLVAVLYLLLSKGQKKESIGEDSISFEKVNEGFSGDSVMVCDEEYLRFHEGLNTFSYQLYHSISSQNPHSNIFFSPTSINSALGLLYFGLDGTCQMDLSSKMEFNEFSYEELARAYYTMNSKTSNFIDINTVSDLWLDNSINIHDDYLSILKNYFKNMERILDLSSKPEESRIVINDYIASKTKDKIKNLLPENSIDSNTKLVLSNALYFNALWENRFDTDSTMDIPFYKMDGNSIITPMMSITASFNYINQNGIHIIELPYEGREYSMILYFPENPSTFDYTKIPNIDLNSLSIERMFISMPLFKIEDEYDLVPFLKDMGLNNLFTNECNLSKISNYQDLIVDKIFHKSFINVNEGGTEAAAATAIVISRGMDLNIPSITLDHPFLFTISNTKSRETLFLGSIFNPSL